METTELLETVAGYHASTQEAPQTEMVEGQQAVVDDAATGNGEMPAEQPAAGQSETGSPERESGEPDYLGFVKKEFGDDYDIDKLKSHVERAKQYDELLKQKEELESTAIKPANDYVKTLNSLIASGAGKDQLNSFIKINNYGDLSELSPLDAKVAKMVLIDGYSEDVARAKVERDYDLEQFEPGSIDRKILEDELRVSSKQDAEALSKYRAELSTFENPSAKDAERIELENKAILAKHQENVRAELPKLASTFNTVKEVVLEQEEGQEPLKHSVEYDKEFKEMMPTLLEALFIDKVEPINPEIAEKFAKAVYLEENFDKIAQGIWNKAKSHFTEKVDNEYVNRGGLPEQRPNPNQSAQKDEVYGFLEKLASGTV